MGTGLRLSEACRRRIRQQVRVGAPNLVARQPRQSQDERYSGFRNRSTPLNEPTAATTVVDDSARKAPWVSSQKIEVKDQKFAADVTQAAFINRLFIRLVSKGHRFSKVDFRYCTFDACYLRNCVFDDCDFTGCRFVSTNLHGSSFVGCKFDYATFEKTDIDVDVLSSGCPGNENLKMRFARSLRVNYQQLGNADAVNKAIAVELDATRIHLEKSWRSNESYYRKKYVGVRRALQFLHWVQFKTLDWIWGNGESVVKLLRAAVIVIALIAAIHAFVFGGSQGSSGYGSALLEAPVIFLGVEVPRGYPALYLTAIVFIRLVLFGLFMAIIIKRLNRR